MTIEIVCAGTEDLLGSAFIIFWRDISDELQISEISLSFFIKNEKMNRVFYYDIISKSLNELNVKKEEQIHLSDTPILYNVFNFLNDAGYHCSITKNEGFLQEKADQIYLDHLKTRFNFICSLQEKHSKYSFQKIQLEWVTEDFPRRSKYIKENHIQWTSKWREESENRWINKMLDEALLKQNRGNKGESKGNLKQNSDSSSMKHQSGNIFPNEVSYKKGHKKKRNNSKKRIFRK